MKARVTLDRLRAVLQYSEETGVFTWRVRTARAIKVGQEAGTITAEGYRHIGIDGVYYGAHRLAWFYTYGEWPLFEIDHENLVKTDNRLSNLRPATNQAQSANRPVYRNNRLKVKGVGISTWRVRKAQRYRARIRVNDRLVHLGYFATPEEAGAAYERAARQHFGKFARSA